MATVAPRSSLQNIIHGLVSFLESLFLRVGSWNVLSLSEDQQLPHLWDELSRLRVDMVGFYETRRPGSGETSSKGFTLAVCCRG